MIDRHHALSIKRQAQMVGISGSSVYYQPHSVNGSDFELIRRIDSLHLEHLMGVRMLQDQLNRAGYTMGCKYVSALMKHMGIEALSRKPGTSKKHPGHKVCPYLLRGLTIDCSNQVWAMDTTYILMARGFRYLFSVVDSASRKVAAKIAITLEACHAVEVLQEAFDRYGTPEIVSTDQGTQFTATKFVKAVEEKGYRLSMDGRGARLDNVIFERLWTSAKRGIIMDQTPVKNELMQRFELDIEGKTAYLEYQAQGPEVLAFTHTFVPSELRGHNLAAILTRYALEDARRQGKKVAPLCSYVEVFIQRNKEFNALRAPNPMR